MYSFTGLKIPTNTTTSWQTTTHDQIWPAAHFCTMLVLRTVFTFSRD